MKNFINIYAIFFFLTIANIAKGQSNRNSIDLEKTRIQKYLTNKIGSKTVDSTFIYSFAIRVEVKKNKIGKLQVMEVSTNDSIAFILYPDYISFFNKVNYSLFIKNFGEKTFIFPVILLILSDKGTTCDFTIGTLTKKFLSAFYFDRTKISKIEKNIYFGPAVVTMGKNTVQ